MCIQQLMTESRGYIWYKCRTIWYILYSVCHWSSCNESEHVVNQKLHLEQAVLSPSRSSLTGDTDTEPTGLADGLLSRACCVIRLPHSLSRQTSRPYSVSWTNSRRVTGVQTDIIVHHSVVTGCLCASSVSSSVTGRGEGGVIMKHSADCILYFERIKVTCSFIRFSEEHECRISENDLNGKLNTAEILTWRVSSTHKYQMVINMWGSVNVIYGSWLDRQLDIFFYCYYYHYYRNVFVSLSPDFLYSLSVSRFLWPHLDPGSAF